MLLGDRLGGGALDAIEEPLLEGARVEHRLRGGERLGDHHHLQFGLLVRVV